MTLSILYAMVCSLELTVVFEILFAFAAGAFDSNTRTGKSLFINLLANVLTNPMVCSLYYLAKYGFGLSGAHIWAVTAVLEISAVLAEWRVYKACTDIKRPFLFSLCANCFSYFTGLLLT